MRKYLKTALFSAFVLSLLGMARIPAHAADISVISVSFPSNIDIDVGSPTDSAGTGTIQNNNSNKVDISFLGIKSSDETSPKVVTPEDDKNYWSNLTPSQTESIINLGFKIGETPYWSPAQTQNSPTNPVGNVITLAPNDTKALTPIARHGLQWTKDAGLNYAAYFRIQPYCKVNVIAGEGGTVTGGGEYKTGSTITITAIPYDGYLFTKWSDGNTNASRTITVTENIDLMATFIIKANQTKAKQISAGGNHTVALLTDGSVVAWGYNGFGQLGDGTTTSRLKPVTVRNLSDVKQVSAGGDFTIALLNDGTVKAWGSNENGLLGDGVAANEHIPVTVKGLSNVKQISAGEDHAVALLNDGTVKAWGYNGFGQLGDGTNIEKHTPITISNLSNVKQVSAGRDFTVALLNDGTVKACGENNDGQLGDGTDRGRNTPVVVSGLSNVKQISAGGSHTVALLNDGTAKAWGYNCYGQLGDGTTTDKHAPTTVVNLSNIKQIDAGHYHTVALLNDGTAKAWGSNSFFFTPSGQLGDGTSIDRYIPVTVSNLSNGEQISAGNFHTVALLNDGTIKAWGDNSGGQLGDGTTTTKLIPITIIV